MMDTLFAIRDLFFEIISVICVACILILIAIVALVPTSEFWMAAIGIILLVKLL